MPSNQEVLTPDAATDPAGTACPTLRLSRGRDREAFAAAMLELAESLDTAALQAAPAIAAAGGGSRAAAVRVARDMAAANHLRGAARALRSASEGATQISLGTLGAQAAGEVARVMRERAEVLRADASAEATYLVDAQRDDRSDPRPAALALVRRLAQAALFADGAQAFTAAAKE